MMESNKTYSKSAPFPMRAVGFRFDSAAVPRYWFAADPVATAYYAVLSLTFPHGERMFIESVKFFKDSLDPELLSNVKAFFGQEVSHGKEHEVFNELLRAHGFDRTGEVERWFAEGLEALQTRLSPKARLAYTVGMEHWTAILGAKMLKEPELRQRFDPSVRELWTWHALEEAEHKAVAFEVYQAVAGGYGLRVAAMLIATAHLLAVGAIAPWLLLRDAEVEVGLAGWIRGLRLLFDQGGVFHGVHREFASYFRPSFHPAQADTRALVAEWRARLFERDGSLPRTRIIWPQRLPSSL